MGRRAVTSGAGDANHVSVYLWRPRESDEGWVLVKPPGAAVKVTAHHLQDLGLRSTTSMKLYSMGGLGPTNIGIRDAAYTAVAQNLNAASDGQIKMFLRLKQKAVCNRLFNEFVDALPFRGDEPRIDHYINIVKNIEANFERLQPPYLRLAAVQKGKRMKKEATDKKAPPQDPKPSASGQPGPNA